MRLTRFFLLVTVLSVPFWVAGLFTGLQLLPGVPVSALMFLCPVTAAVILVYREHRTGGVAALLKRSFDYDRIGDWRWFIAIVLLPPAAIALSYLSMKFTGVEIPAPQVQVFPAIGLFMALFAAALGEELGWTGYAMVPLQQRWGALQTGIMLGLLWSAWHIIPLVQAGRAPVWIAWWSLGTVSNRVVMVWIYNNTGKSVFAAAVYHAMINLAWQLFPVNGSYFDPLSAGMIMAAVAALVTFLWGPETLARFRFNARRTA